MQHVGDHLDLARSGQVVQRDVSHSGLVAPSRQQRRQRVRRVHVAVAIAVGADQQQALDRLAAQHTVDEAERRPPRPLKVIDEHHHRPQRRGDSTQHRHGRLRRPSLCRQRIPRGGRDSEQRRELRHHGGQQTRVGSDRGQDPLPERGQITLRLGEQHPAQRAKRLMGRVELEVAPVLVELAGHEPTTPARHDQPHLGGQRRLADPRRAADQHAATPARQRVLERAPQRCQLGVASHEPRRRQQPQREVPLADAQRSIC